MSKLRFLALPLVALIVLLLAGCSDKKDDRSTNSTQTIGVSVSTSSTGSTSSNTAGQVSVTVKVDFGSGTTVPPLVNKTVGVAEKSTAWDTVQAAVGTDNVQFTDYGGSLGIFITGFMGVSPSGNSFWEFQVNGKASDVGVSSYIVQDKDVLSFQVKS